MPRYLAIFTGTPESRAASGWDALPEEQRKAREREGIAAWKQWMALNSGAVQEQGSPLGKTLRIDKRGVHPIQNAMTAWVVVDADSHEVAARMFEQHPHFAIFPDDGIEVMECLPMPKG
jgi:hypothetical protein